MAPDTQSVVSGLAAGTYFWRVQAVSNDFVSGPFSAAAQRHASPAPVRAPRRGRR